MRYKIYSKFEIINIYLAVDAQVVISWLLSDNVKTSNMFARNHIKDVHSMLKKLKENYKIPIKFKYVPTDENLDDLLTLIFSRRIWIFGFTDHYGSNLMLPRGPLMI